MEGKVAQLFGMLHPGESSTVTVRAVFVIDPKAKIRAILSEDLNKFGVLISELRGFEAEVGRDSATLGISAEDLIRISAHLRDIIELLIDMHALKKLLAEAT